MDSITQVSIYAEWQIVRSVPSIGGNAIKDRMRKPEGLFGLMGYAENCHHHQVLNRKVRRKWSLFTPFGVAFIWWKGRLFSPDVRLGAISPITPSRPLIFFFPFSQKPETPTFRRWQKSKGCNSIVSRKKASRKQRPALKRRFSGWNEPWKPLLPFSPSFSLALFTHCF